MFAAEERGLAHDMLALKDTCPTLGVPAPSSSPFALADAAYAA